FHTHMHAKTLKGGTALLSQPLESPPETPKGGTASLSGSAFGSSGGKECALCPLFRLATPKGGTATLSRLPSVSQSERQRSFACKEKLSYIKQGTGIALQQWLYMLRGS